MAIFEYLIKIPIGYLLGWIYELLNNYGWALIVFTVLIKFIILPLGLKQQKSMTVMQKIQPKLEEIKEKYKNDQNRQSQETMKLYKEYGASPMGGCLPLLIQLPILFGLYRVLYRPLTYMLHMADSKVWDLACRFAVDTSKTNTMAQIEIAEKANLINFDFLGLNLANNPSFKFWWTLAIPVLAGVTTYLASKMTQLINKKDSKKNEPEKKQQRILNPEQKTPSAGSGTSAESMNKTMTMIMPLFTVWITYTLPMALGVYWIVSNVFSIGQTVLLNGYYSQKLGSEILEHDADKKEKKEAKYGVSKKKRKGNRR